MPIQLGLILVSAYNSISFREKVKKKSKSILKGYEFNRDSVYYQLHTSRVWIDLSLISERGGSHMADRCVFAREK